MTVIQDHNYNLQLQSSDGFQQKNSRNNSQSLLTSRRMIERGLTWSYNETRILLSLWGQEMVQKQSEANFKRSSPVWEKIAEKLREHKFVRTADQVRNRFFKMISDYRRILKNPTSESKEKCLFFDAIHKIHQAKDTNDVKIALKNHEEDFNLDPIDFTNIKKDDMNDGTECEFFSYVMSPSNVTGWMNETDVYTGGGGASDDSCESDDVDEHQAKKLCSDSNPFVSDQKFDSSLLIDRIFATLDEGTKVMRKWIHLEQERLSQEVIWRKEEMEREERKEKTFISILTRMQDQMFSYKCNCNGRDSSSDIL